MKKILTIAVIALFVIFIGSHLFQGLSFFTWIAFKYLSQAVVYVFALVGLIAVVRYIWIKK
jgi:hypothetical protein